MTHDVDEIIYKENNIHMASILSSIQKSNKSKNKQI